MANYATPMQSRNQMSAATLKETTGSEIQFINNPKKPGSLFFTCGTQIATGYISPKVQEKYREGTLKLGDMVFAECSTDGTNWVPCLMLKTSNNVVASF